MAHKIGLVTWYDSYNYGTCLQCYALGKYLENKGYDIYVIENAKYYYGIKHPIDTLKKIINKTNKSLKKTNKQVEISSELKRQFKVRRDKNHRFAYEENNIFYINSKKDYNKMLRLFDVFITGSDQIWNPYFVSPTMLLAFTKRKHKKVAYASSIGVSEIPSNLIKTYKKYLSRFNYIGVREKTAKELIKSLINKDVETVVDPTFLLDGNYWNNFAKMHNEMIPHDKYIFCYFIGSSTMWYDDIKKFVNINNMKIIIALSESNIIPDFGEIVPNAGVADFISFISNAAYVVTDSFHACALSINMNKEFVVYKRFADDSSSSQNSRIYDLLESCKLTNRIIDKNNNFENIIKEKIPYHIINDIVAINREQSEQYLSEAINS